MIDELPFKVVRSNGTDEVLARAMILLIARGYGQCPRPVSSSNVLQLEIEPLLSPVLNQCTL
jgi:hypothetical protein